MTTTAVLRLGSSGLVATLLLVGCGSNQQASNPEAPPFVFRSLDLQQKRTNGQRDWDLISPEARYEFKRRLIRARRPEGVLYRDDQPSFRISADRATVVNDGELVLLLAVVSAHGGGRFALDGSDAPRRFTGWR